jgi:hypothetical protein
MQKLRTKFVYNVTLFSLIIGMAKNVKQEVASPGEGLRALFIVVIIIIIIYKGCFSEDKSSSQENRAVNSSGEEITLPDDYPSPAEAYVNAQYYIREQLTNPSSADFPIMSGFHVEAVPQDTSYRISSYVDHQNLYGSTIRTKWYVRLHYHGGDKSDPQSYDVYNRRFLN